MPASDNAAVRRPYVIWAPAFDENSGGSIVLHRLCHMLNENGCEAYLWPTPLIQDMSPLRRILKDHREIRRYFWKFINRAKKGFRYTTQTVLNTPIAPRGVLERCIVVYPEMVAGNPLGVKRVARWFLHRPGYFTGRVNYGENEVYFFNQAAFNDPAINQDPDNHMKLTWFRDDIYRQWNFGDRHGACYIERKGKARFDLPMMEGAERIDELYHKEIAEVFNTRKYLISFDHYTMYCLYAAVCGCVPIVVPAEGVSKTEWRPRKRDRYGVAYGFDDVERAVETRPQLLQKIVDEAEEEHAMLVRFIEITQNRFAD